MRCSEQVSSQPKEGIVEADKDVRCMCSALCMCSNQIGVNDDVSWLLATAQNNQPVLSINRLHENSCSYPKNTQQKDMLESKILFKTSLNLEIFDKENDKEYATGMLQQYILWMIINHCCGPSTKTFISANVPAVFGGYFLQIQHPHI